MICELILNKVYGWAFFIEFPIAALVILIAGMNLSKYGDAIGSLTGLGQTWVGLTLLSVVTSLPELVVNISSVAYGVPEIVLGNVYGSNVFNIFVIGVLDIVQGHGPIMRQINIRQILPAALGILLSVLGILAIVVVSIVGDVASQMGTFFSIVIVVLFLGGNRMIYSLETRKARRTQQVEDEEPVIPKSKAFVMFFINTLFIVGAGIWLINIATELSEFPILLGERTIVLGTTFVGTIVLAAITSLPELVVAISSFRMGAVNMAVANLFGSCGFNVVLIPMMDFFITGASIYQYADSTLLIPATMSVIMMTIAVMGLIYRSTKSYLTMGWDGLLIFFMYFLGNYLFFYTSVAVR